MDQFDAVSPLDYRYYGNNAAIYEKVHPYFSERAQIRYCLKVEVALARGLARRGLFPAATAEEMEAASGQVSAEEVYREDERIHHYTRAIVECLRRHLSEAARPFAHLFATSFDVMDTAQALRLRDFVQQVGLPQTEELERVLIRLARDNAEAVQIGRTHGQHAVPITFGFAMAGYVDRLGTRIERLRRDTSELRGKLSGAVGAYNAFSLALPDPEQFEEEVLGDLGLRPGRHSTQIVAPEYVTDLMCTVVSCLGVLANLADDLRHLQRTEISEVYELFEGAQVGSSTMPHKRNPWNFEHIKSLWKAFMPRIVTVFADQISEHQRDLTNSASQRFLPEILVGFLDAVDRAVRRCRTLRVDAASMRRNLEASAGSFVSEPLYVLLALAGLPDAHEAVRALTLKTGKEQSLVDAVMAAPELERYVRKIPPEKLAALRDAAGYTGVAARKAREVCRYWEARLFGSEGA